MKATSRCRWPSRSLTGTSQRWRDGIGNDEKCAVKVARGGPAPLTNAGFPPADALHVYRTYYGFLFGSVLNELREVVTDAQESEDLLRLGLHRLPAEEFPHLRALANDLAHFDGAAELDLGLKALLNRTPGTTGRSQPSPVTLPLLSRPAAAASCLSAGRPHDSPRA